MTPEVKNKIEQIRRGNVPEGYKKTKIGIIPNEWRVGAVGECIEEYKRFSNDVTHIPVYSSSRQGLIPYSDYYNQRTVVETNLGYKVVPQEYVTYRHMSDDNVFHFNINRTGGEVLVSSEYPVFKSSSNCDLTFLISILNNTTRFRYFCKTQKLGGTRTRLYLDNLKKYALALPPYSEQIKISEILTLQDKVIELEEKKIEELKKVKKYFLNKMFPQKGQSVPEIRVKGFTDAWEQRKLGEIAKITIGEFVIKTKQDDSYPYPVFNGGSSNTGYYNEFNNEGNKILVSARGANAGFVNIIKSRFWAGNSCYSIDLIDKNKYDTDYIFQEMKCNQSRFTDNQQAANIPAVSKSDVEKFVVSVPKYDEQVKIADYFTNLDNLITLHQRKLEEEKQKKKALMQLLLTGIVRVCE